MAESKLRDRSRVFAKDIVLFCRKIRKKGVENWLTLQLQRAGTSIGANIHEAQYAQGAKDFASKLQIALKECNETEYWLNLLYDTDSIFKEDYDRYRKETIEICRMLVSSINTIKKSG